jgi:hypothetical protein
MTLTPSTRQLKRQLLRDDIAREMHRQCDAAEGQERVSERVIARYREVGDVEIRQALADARMDAATGQSRN